MKILILIISITFVNIQHSSSSSTFNNNVSETEINNVEIQKTFDLLEEGQRNIILSQQRDLVLILGNTGSGKSTIIQWLFGDNEKLMATPTADGSLIIVDGHRIGHSTIESKTLFPELVIDNITNTAYYDCPGFSDTRSTSHDIAITYFIKRVADHARRIKLVFIVSHSSLRIGVDRQDFSKLLTHATDFIQDVDKFNRSIAIIATKVEDAYEEHENGSEVLICDEDVIDGIAGFLTEVKVSLQTNEPSKIKAVQFLDVLLTRNGGDEYSRIGLFRRPSRAGPLSADTTLQDGKVHVMKILNNLIFSVTSEKDFGYTVSDEAKGDIGYLIRDIGTTVEKTLDEMGNEILEHFCLLVIEGQKKLEIFVSEDEEDNVNLPKEINKLKRVLMTGIRGVSRLARDVKIMKKPSQLTKIINNSSLSNSNFIDFQLNDSSLIIISKQSEYFDFLQVVNKEPISIPKSWALNLQSTARDLSILNAKFLNYTELILEKIVARVDDAVSSFGLLIFEYHKEMVERMKGKINLGNSGTTCISLLYINPADVSKMKESVDKALNVTSNLVKSIRNAKNLTMLFDRTLKTLRSVIPRNRTMTIIKLKKYLKFLQLLNKKNDKMRRKSWSVLFEKEVVKISNLNADFETFTNSMIEIVTDGISRIIENSMQILTDYYREVAVRINSETNSAVNGSSSPSTSPLRVRELVNELRAGLDTMTNISAESLDVENPLEFAQKIKSFISVLNIEPLNNAMANMANQFSCLHFLILINNQEFITPIDWVNAFRNTLSHMTELRDNCDLTTSELTVEVKNSIGHLIEVLGQAIQNYFANVTHEMEAKIDMFFNASSHDDEEIKVNSIPAQTYRYNLMIGLKAISALPNSMPDLTDARALADLISQSVRNIDRKLGLLSAEIVENLEINCGYLNYLLIVSNESMKVERSWVNRMRDTNEYVFELKKQFDGKAMVLVAEVESRIAGLVEQFARALHRYYAEKLNEVKLELSNFTVINSTDKEVDLARAKEMAVNLKNALIIMSNLSTRIQSLNTPLTLKCVLNDSISPNLDGFRSSESLIKNVSFQAEVLNYLLIISSSNVEFKSPAQWLTPLKNITRDFSLSLENFQILDMNETREIVYSLLKSDIRTLAFHIIEHYERETSEEKSSNNLIQNLKNAEIAILKLINKNKNVPKLYPYLDNIFECVTELNIDKEMIKQAFKRYAQLEFMQAFSTENELIISVKPFSNFEPFEPVAKFVRQSHVWYTFLSELDEKLSQYEIQRDVSRYNVANLEDWGDKNKPQGISIHKNNFHKLLDNLYIFKGEIRHVELTPSRLKALDNVFAINIRSKYDPICECRENILFKGNFVKLSDFINENGAYQNPCHFHSPNLDISAAKTIFIDRNFIAIGSQFNISIKAPKWEVIGSSRSIILDGTDGQSHYPDRASDGREPGFKGVDGKAGMAGGAAGTFIGFGNTFINGRQLSISAQGGRGGRGQHGGRGRDGHNGDFVTYARIAHGNELSNARWLYSHLSLPGDRANALGFSLQCDRSCKNVKGCVCTAYGKSGQRGGDGGNGGEGGKGGKEGKVVITELGNASEISRLIKPGAAGLRGEGGAGGKGGESQKVKFKYQIKFYVPIVNPAKFSFLGDIREVAENGKRGQG